MTETTLNKRPAQGRLTRWMIYAGVSILALIAGVIVAGLDTEEMLGATGNITQLEGASVLEPAKPIPDFSLNDSLGKAFNRESLLGQWTFVFFGYTYCPDVCPTALARFNEVHEVLEANSELADTAFVFVSVDPQRDSLKRLGDYVRYFNPAFQAATGETEQIDTFARASGAVYLRVPGRDEDNYLIDHTAAVFLYNPAGELRAIFNAPHDPLAISKALRAIRSKTL
ncbi:MAG: SCO family protein [Gammaproteobacteria bacterium]